MITDEPRLEESRHAKQLAPLCNLVVRAHPVDGALASKNRRPERLADYILGTVACFRAQLREVAHGRVERVEVAVLGQLERVVQT